MRQACFILAALTLGGCGLRDCSLGLAHRDCDAAPYATRLPQDDSVCRSYGLIPGTRDYASCRASKHRVGSQARDESDYGFLRNPILPDVH